MCTGGHYINLNMWGFANFQSILYEMHLSFFQVQTDTWYFNICKYRYKAFFIKVVTNNIITFFVVDDGATCKAILESLKTPRKIKFGMLWCHPKVSECNSAVALPL